MAQHQTVVKLCQCITVPLVADCGRPNCYPLSFTTAKVATWDLNKLYLSEKHHTFVFDK